MRYKGKKLPTRQYTLVIILFCLFSGSCLAVATTYLIYQMPFLNFTIPERTISNSSLPLQLKWTFNLDDPNHSQPYAADDVVLIRMTNSIVGIDAETGAELWRARVGTNELPPSSVYAGDGLVAPIEHKSLRVIDTHTGQLLWNWSPGEFNGYIASILIARTIVYVSVRRACDPLWAFSARDGRLLWQTRQFPNGECDGGDLFLQGNNLYLITGPKLYILDANTGTVMKVVTGFRGGGFQPLLGDNVYWSTGGSDLGEHLPILLAEEASTGRDRWEFYGRCKRRDNDPLRVSLINQHLYAGGGCHALFAFDPDTGRLLWKTQLSANVVGRIQSIDSTGYAMLGDSSIHASDLESGESRGNLQTDPAGRKASLSAQGLDSNGKLLFATFGDRQLFAFGK